MKKRIGFIGLGVMGKPMARNLRAASTSSCTPVHRAPSTSWRRRAPSEASDPSELAAGVDVVITMLPDTPDVDRVLFGEGGVAGGIRPGSLVIDMSTIRPTEAAGSRSASRPPMSRCSTTPMLGGERGAIDGTLSIMVGGQEDAFARALPIRILGGNVTHVGGSGAGQGRGPAIS